MSRGVGVPSSLPARWRSLTLRLVRMAGGLVDLIYLDPAALDPETRFPARASRFQATTRSGTSTLPLVSGP